jgi:hypothetical protein
LPNAQKLHSDLSLHFGQISEGGNINASSLKIISTAFVMGTPKAQDRRRIVFDDFSENCGV